MDEKGVEFESECLIYGDALHPAAEEVERTIVTITQGAANPEAD
jgi:hypothetical protein